MPGRIAVIVALAALTVAVGTEGASAARGMHRSTPTVLFVLRGKLGSFAPANGPTSGSIAITVKGSTYESKRLANVTLTFPVSATTKIVGTVTSGHLGIVKVRAAKNASASSLGAIPPLEIIDQGKRA
jgi:hypothetical protein